MKTVWICALIVVIGNLNFVMAQTAEVRQKHFLVEDGVAIEGYDPVAYHTDNTAVEGKKSITTVHEGITYRFASEENRKTFQENPEKYLPAYGGWCAYALAANGEKMEPDPETFKLQEGKLYLFYNGFFNNTLPKWNKKEKEMKEKADKAWEALIAQ